MIFDDFKEKKNKWNAENVSEEFGKFWCQIFSAKTHTPFAFYMKQYFDGNLYS